MIVNNTLINNSGSAMYQVRSEVTGSVWKVEASVGQRVDEGDTLLVVESMKMEIPVTAPVAGVVRELMVLEGDAVADDQLLVVLG
jgi:acetyl-CoA carboxylase biotin carboxyl carrier protein